MYRGPVWNARCATLAAVEVVEHDRGKRYPSSTPMESAQTWTTMKPVIERFIALLVAALVAGSLACDTTVDGETQGPPDDVIRVLWNPAEGQLPSPNDLVRDDEAETLAIPVDEEDPPAQKAFVGYLNSLDGFPLSTEIRIPVSAPIDDNSLGRGVEMIRVPHIESVSTDARYDEAESAIIVEPRQPLQPGQRYVVAVRGYQYGAVGVDGERVIADAPFFLVRSTASLSDHPAAVPGDSAEERQQTADDLAQLQDELADAFDAIEARDIERDEIAALFEFTTTSEPAVRFDAAGGDVPIPNDLLVDPNDDGLELPVDEDMGEEEQKIREVLSQLDGFSMSGAVVVRSTHDVGDNEPPAQGFRIFERSEQGQWSELHDVHRGRLDDEQTAWLRPDLTLEPDTEYVYVVTDALETKAGQPHRPQPLGAMLALDAPLTDTDGAAQIDSLDDAQARRLEPLRERVDDLLSHLETTESFDRRQVAAAVPFRTATAAQTLLERRAELYDRDVSTAVTNIETTAPSGLAGLFLLNNVETVIRGEMTILDYLDPTTRAWRDDGEPVEETAKFVLTLPEDVDITQPIPVVLFGHGLKTSRELLYLIAGELASAGYAAFAMDLPYHGDRAVCVEDKFCEEGASCDEEGQCRHPDGSKAEVREIEVMHLAPFLEGTQYDDLLNYPMNSGMVFIDMDSLHGTRDHFAQAMLDLNQAVRVIRGEELDDVVVGETGLWLGDEILYLGMSLGGIVGAGLTAVEPEIDDFVLNVAAADLSLLIEHSVAFETVFEQAMDARDIEQGSDEYFTFLNAARWLFDPIDPLNLVQHAVDDPLDYVDPESGEVIDDRQARVMIQMAEGDLVVPNVGTEVLSQRMGIDYEKYEPGITDHAFLFDPTMLDGATRDARQDLIDFFDNR